MLRKAGKTKGALPPPSAFRLPPRLVVPVMAVDADERVGARGARALDLDAVARVELRDVGREVRGDVAVDACDGDDAAVDGDVAVQLDRLRLRRLGRLAAAGGDHDRVAAGRAAAELAVREAARRRPVGGE